MFIANTDRTPICDDLLGMHEPIEVSLLCDIITYFYIFRYYLSQASLI